MSVFTLPDLIPTGKRFWLWLLIISRIALSGYAQVPDKIPYQGTIANSSGEPYSGTFDFKFDLKDDHENLVWSSGKIPLAVDIGAYSVELGDSGQPALPSSIWIDHDHVLLHVSFDDGIHGLETLSPGIRILAVPYARRAVYADSSGNAGFSLGDSLVLRDSTGAVRMVLNPNTGMFKMMDHDTVWHSVRVASPPETVELLGNGLVLERKKLSAPQGGYAETIYDQNNNGQVVKRFLTYKDGPLTCSSLERFADNGTKIYFSRICSDGTKQVKRWQNNGTLILDRQESSTRLKLLKYDAGGVLNSCEIKTFDHDTLRTYEAGILVGEKVVFHVATPDSLLSRTRYFNAAGQVVGRRTVKKDFTVIVESYDTSGNLIYKSINDVAIVIQEDNVKDASSIYDATKFKFTAPNDQQGFQVGSNKPGQGNLKAFNKQTGDSVDIQLNTDSGKIETNGKIEVRDKATGAKTLTIPKALICEGSGYVFDHSLDSDDVGKISVRNKQSGKKAGLRLDADKEEVSIDADLRLKGVPIKGVPSEDSLVIEGDAVFAYDITVSGETRLSGDQLYLGSGSQAQLNVQGGTLFSWHVEHKANTKIGDASNDSLDVKARSWFREPVTFDQGGIFTGPVVMGSDTAISAAGLFQTQAGLKTNTIEPFNGNVVGIGTNFDVTGDATFHAGVNINGTLDISGVANITNAGDINANQINGSTITAGSGLVTNNIDPVNPGADIKINGDVTVTGNFAKGSGSFKIDHPLDPYGKYLYHSFVESPDMMNIYNGNVTTDSVGRAVVELPDYFEALNMDFRYQLTVIGTFARAIVSKEVDGNVFEIRTDLPHIKVSWMVTGVRQDTFAHENRILTEVDKEPEMQGKLLYTPRKAMK